MTGLIVAAALLGLVAGAVINSVVFRVPVMMRRESENFIALETGREPVHTDTFNFLLPARTGKGSGAAFLELVPLIGHSLAGGKKPVREIGIELFTAAASAGLVFHFDYGAVAASSLLFTWLLIALTFIDLDTKYLPDDLTYFLLWCGLFVNINGTIAPLDNAVVGAAVGYSVLWTFAAVFKLFTRRDSMGHGDFKLMAAIGAWLGYSLVPAVVLISVVVGAIAAVVFALSKKHSLADYIPFGPYIAATGLVVFWFKSCEILWL